jgi:hypothetical protein
MYGFWLPLGYLQTLFKKVDNLDRENLLQYNIKKQNNRVPLVITYSKALPNIHEILKKNIKSLYNSEKMKRIFDERL